MQRQQLLASSLSRYGNLHIGRSGRHYAAHFLGINKLTLPPFTFVSYTQFKSDASYYTAVLPFTTIRFHLYAFLPLNVHQLSVCWYVWTYHTFLSFIYFPHTLHSRPPTSAVQCTRSLTQMQGVHNHTGAFANTVPWTNKSYSTTLVKALGLLEGYRCQEREVLQVHDPTARFGCIVPVFVYIVSWRSGTPQPVKWRRRAQFTHLLWHVAENNDNKNNSRYNSE